MATGMRKLRVGILGYGSLGILRFTSQSLFLFTILLKRLTISRTAYSQSNPIKWRKTRS